MAKRRTAAGTGRMTIRPLTQADESILWTMLYQALYVPPGQPPFPAEIVHEPALSGYVENWGQPGDLGFVTLLDYHPVGAAWLRLLTGDNRGFGHVDETTPELSIAVLPEFRGLGIGTRLLTLLLQTAQAYYGAVCLSVSPDNPALRLYQRLGFETVGTSGSSLTMLKRWEGEP